MGFYFRWTKKENWFFKLFSLWLCPLNTYIYMCLCVIFFSLRTLIKTSSVLNERANDCMTEWLNEWMNECICGQLKMNRSNQWAKKHSFFAVAKKLDRTLSSHTQIICKSFLDHLYSLIRNNSLHFMVDSKPFKQLILLKFIIRCMDASGWSDGVAVSHSLIIFADAFSFSHLLKRANEVAGRRLCACSRARSSSPIHVLKRSAFSVSNECYSKQASKKQTSSGRLNSMEAALNETKAHVKTDKRLSHTMMLKIINNLNHGNNSILFAIYFFLLLFEFSYFLLFWTMF